MSLNQTNTLGTMDSSSSDKYIGLSLALSSSFLIGTSFILTKKGLMESARSGPGIF